MLYEIESDDSRGRFTDVIRARTPLGWREQLKDIARQRGVSFGQLVRDALVAYVATLQETSRASRCGGLTIEGHRPLGVLILDPRTGEKVRL